MGSSSADLTVIIELIIVAVLWTAFNGLFYNGELTQKEVPTLESTSFTSVLLGGLSSFFSYMFITSDIAIINVFVIGTITAIVVILALRFARG